MTLRMACLDRQLQGLSALVEVLGQADAAMLEKAPTRGRRAGLARHLRGRVGAAGRGAAAARSRACASSWSAIRAQLSRAVRAPPGGPVGPGRRRGAGGVKAARATGERSVLAETLAEEGRIRLSVDPSRAAELLTEAFWGALLDAARSPGDGRGDLALDARYTLTSHYDQAAFWQEYAQAGLERIGGDEELEAELWAERGRRADEMRQVRRVAGRLLARGAAGRATPRPRQLQTLRRAERRADRADQLARACSRPAAARRRCSRGR